MQDLSYRIQLQGFASEIIRGINSAPPKPMYHSIIENLLSTNAVLRSYHDALMQQYIKASSNYLGKTSLLVKIIDSFIQRADIKLYPNTVHYMVRVSKTVVDKYEDMKDEIKLKDGKRANRNDVITEILCENEMLQIAIMQLTDAIKRINYKLGEMEIPICPIKLPRLKRAVTKNVNQLSLF